MTRAHDTRTGEGDLFGNGSGARFSPCGLYRYSLTRRWAPGPTALWIPHNPSIADGKRSDPTATRMVKFSTVFGCGAMEVVNPFAYVCTDKKALLGACDPVGPENDQAIREALARCDGPAIVCWGDVEKRLRWRIDEAWALLAGRKLHALGFTGAGDPKHPLARGKSFIPYDAPLIAIPGSAGGAG